MTEQDYIKSIIGKPWIERAVGPDSYDCWGVIVDYYKQVKGVNLNIFIDGDMGDLFDSEIDSGQWSECASGVVFMGFKGNIPVHCGLLIDGEFIHASGHHGQGQVCKWKASKMKRLFKDLRIYKHATD
jgi:cell wall-associated NlpC family hydrolase